jgi:hypothetical protein
LVTTKSYQEDNENEFSVCECLSKIKDFLNNFPSKETNSILNSDCLDIEQASKRY